MLDLHDVGNRIRDQRLRLNWSQDELRSRMGNVSKAHLSDLENGKKEPGAGKLLSLSMALGVSVDWLLTGLPLNGRRKAK